MLWKTVTIKWGKYGTAQNWMSLQNWINELIKEADEANGHIEGVCPLHMSEPWGKLTRLTLHLRKKTSPTSLCKNTLELPELVKPRLDFWAIIIIMFYTNKKLLITKRTPYKYESRFMNIFYFPQFFIVSIIWIGTNDRSHLGWNKFKNDLASSRFFTGQLFKKKILSTASNFRCKM